MRFDELSTQILKLPKDERPLLVINLRRNQNNHNARWAFYIRWLVIRGLFVHWVLARQNFEQAAFQSSNSRSFLRIFSFISTRLHRLLSVGRERIRKPPFLHWLANKVHEFIRIEACKSGDFADETKINASIICIFEILLFKKPHLQSCHSASLYFWIMGNRFFSGWPIISMNWSASRHTKSTSNSSS